jgi:hypothetical protein
LSGTAGIAAYQSNGTGYDELIAKAAQALKDADIAGLGEVCLASDTDNH